MNLITQKLTFWIFFRSRIVGFCVIILLSNSIAQENIQAPVVFIENGYDSGTGLLTGTKGQSIYIITAAHVISDSTNLMIKFFSQEKFNATVLRYEEEMDIAVLTCNVPENFQVPSSFKLSTGKITVNQEVTIVSHPLTEEWDINKRARIKRIQEGFVKGRFSLTPEGIKNGSSGGVILNNANEWIGIVLSTNPIKTTCLSSQILKEMLLTWQIPTNLLTGDIGFYETPALIEAERTIIPKGFFLMGDNEGRSNQKPEHTVRIDSFYLQTAEVTNQEYCSFLNFQKIHRREALVYIKLLGSSIQFDKETNKFITKRGYEEHPVTFVSWMGAEAYCKWLDGRLPTEAEWEYVAKSAYLESNGEPDEFTWYGANSNSRLQKIRQKMPNHFGIYDLQGNAWEWVSDFYQSSYQKVNQTDNPTGPSRGMTKVIRGGSVISPLEEVLPAFRKGILINTRENYIGCRCAWSLN